MLIFDLNKFLPEFVKAQIKAMLGEAFLKAVRASG